MLQAWHGWVLRELGLFKAKFRGAAATLLGAGDCRGFSFGALLAPVRPHARLMCAGGGGGNLG